MAGKKYWDSNGNPIRDHDTAGKGDKSVHAGIPGIFIRALGEKILAFFDSEQFENILQRYEGLQSPGRGRYSRQVTGALLLALIITGTAAFTSYFTSLSGIWGLITAVFALMSVIFGKQYFGDSMIFAGIVLFMASLGAGPGFADYLYMKSAGQVKVYSSFNVLEYPEAAGFIISNLKIKTEYSGTYVEASHDSDGRTTYSHWHVAPVVQDAWSQDDVVPAWSACEFDEINDCLRYWSGPISKRALVVRAMSGPYRKAARNSAGKHSIKILTDPVILKFVDNIDDEIYGRLKTALLFLAAALFIYIAGTGGYQVYNSLSLRRKRQG